MTNQPLLYFLCQSQIYLLTTESKEKCPIKHKNVDCTGYDSITQDILYSVGNENCVVLKLEIGGQPKTCEFSMIFRCL